MVKNPDADGSVARTDTKTNVLAHTPKNSQSVLLPEEEKRVMRKKDSKGVTGWNLSRGLNEYLTVLKKDVWYFPGVMCRTAKKT